ncbi:hypothetical protein V6N13_019836 [Hibiscus sabdariffa]
MIISSLQEIRKSIELSVKSKNSQFHQQVLSTFSLQLDRRNRRRGRTLIGKAYTSTTTMTDLTISDIIYSELKTTSRLEYLGTNLHVPSKPNPDDKWVDDHSQARRLIHESLHENLYMSYQKHETAKSLMDALTTDFTRHFESKRFMLFRRYKDYKMQEGSSITQHIIGVELEGMNLPKELQSLVLLESLPESWDDVVTSITMDLGKDEKALRSDNICMRLLNAGDEKELFESHDNEESSSWGGFNGNCYSCGEFGHRISDCPN